MANKIITIDAGHGLKTSGKQTASNLGTVYKEWSLNDKVVRKIMSALANYNGVEVHRIDDPTGATDIALQTRVNKSNSLKADIHISIHQNAGGGTGTEVYWHTNGTAEDKKLASIVAPKLASKTGLRNRGVKTAQFAVLTCRATAILCEGGFMDTANDYAVITSDKGQQAYADAVVEGLVEYLGLTKKVQQPTQPQPVQPTQPTQPSGAFKVGEYNGYVKTTDSLNIRSTRNASGALKGTLPKGTTVKVEYILYQDNSTSPKGSLWGSVYTSYGDGFINMNYVQPTSAPSSVTEYKVKVVNCSTLNVRKGAGIEYPVTATVKVGDVYTIVGEVDGWLKLKSGVGYISKKYTQKI